MPKPQYKSTKITASRLMADDKFKVAGQMYIVTDVETAYGGRLSISFEPLVDKDTIKQRYAMYVPTHMKLKIYNKR